VQGSASDLRDHHELLDALPSPETYKPIPSAKVYEAACQRRLMVGGERHHLWLAHLLEESPGSLAAEKNHPAVFGMASHDALLRASLSRRCWNIS
jgi:hypothetical protein